MNDLFYLYTASLSLFLSPHHYLFLFDKAFQLNHTAITVETAIIKFSHKFCPFYFRLFCAPDNLTKMLLYKQMKQLLLVKHVTLLSVLLVILCSVLPCHISLVLPAVLDSVRHALPVMFTFSLVLPFVCYIHPVIY